MCMFAANKYSIEANGLQINQLTVEDSGVYICRAVVEASGNLYGIVHQMVSLEVRREYIFTENAVERRPK